MGCVSWPVSGTLKKEKQNKQSGFISEAGDYNRCGANTVASDVAIAQLLLWHRSVGVTEAITSLKRLKFHYSSEVIFQGKLLSTSFMACSGILSILTEIAMRAASLVREKGPKQCQGEMSPDGDTSPFPLIS